MKWPKGAWPAWTPKSQIPSIKFQTISKYQMTNVPKQIARKSPRLSRHSEAALHAVYSGPIVAQSRPVHMINDSSYGNVLSATATEAARQPGGVDCESRCFSITRSCSRVQ